MTALVALLLIAAPARPAGVASVSAFDKVTIPRMLGLGGAGVALGYDPDLFWINAAAPALVERTSVSLSGHRGTFDELTSFARGTLPAENGTATAAIAFYDAGSVTANTPDGSVVTFDSQRDVVFAFGFAGSVGVATTMGASLKYLRTELAGEYPANMLAVDAGAQFRASDSVKIGASVRNVGTPIRYAGDSTPSPTTVRLGVAMAWRLGIFRLDSDLPNDAFMALIDVEEVVVSQRLWYRSGVEYRIGRVLAIRGGWRQGPPGSLGGVSAGASAGLSRPAPDGSITYRVDYAVEFNTGPFDRPQSLGLTIEW